jgi:hypothetical protein
MGVFLGYRDITQRDIKSTTQLLVFLLIPASQAAMIECKNSTEDYEIWSLLSLNSCGAVRGLIIKVLRLKIILGNVQSDTA